MDLGDKRAIKRSPLFQTLGSDLLALLAESGSVRDASRGV